MPLKELRPQTKREKETTKKKGRSLLLERKVAPSKIQRPPREKVKVLMRKSKVSRYKEILAKRSVLIKAKA